MAIQAVIQRNALVTAYTTAATYSALSSTAPGSSPGTEISGGSYARVSLSWSAAANSASSATATHNVPSGATVAGAMLYDAATNGNYRDGTSVTSQAFSSAGTYTVSWSYTQQ